MCGADVNLTSLNISRPVYVYDNEPRNVHIHQRMLKQIESENKVVIWPSSIKEKDMNDMILVGYDVQQIIESNVYSGLEANLNFNNWKKI
jgi:hypothetical protein